MWCPGCVTVQQWGFPWVVGAVNLLCWGQPPLQAPPLSRHRGWIAPLPTLLWMQGSATQMIFSRCLERKITQDTGQLDLMPDINIHCPATGVTPSHNAAGWAPNPAWQGSFTCQGRLGTDGRYLPGRTQEKTTELSDVPLPNRSPNLDQDLG